MGSAKVRKALAWSLVAGSLPLAAPGMSGTRGRRTPGWPVRGPVLNPAGRS